MAAPAPEQIAPGVHRVADGVVNWYLVEEGGQLALVDAGWPRSWPRVEAVLEGLGWSPRDISAIVLTHGHPDHLGAAEKARQATGAPVYAHRPEIARARGEAKGASPFSLVPGLLPTLWRPSAFGFVLHATANGFMTPKWVSETPTIASTCRGGRASFPLPAIPRAMWRCCSRSTASSSPATRLPPTTFSRTTAAPSSCRIR